MVIYPTDTIYGLGCDITNKAAVERLYRVRGFDAKKPLSFLCRDLKHISDYAWLSKWQYKIMRRLLPGPYTMVLPASREVPKHMVKKKKEVGIRIPYHEVPKALLAELGNPIITTSLGEDPDTELPYQDPDEIEQVFRHDVDFFLDAGYGGIDPSTVIKLVDDEVEVLRQGIGPLDGVLD
jgi:tRNA threonylcarbamoyl adenosine modification protein (Sua5/YciO/YrdC/YwlC family)